MRLLDLGERPADDAFAMRAGTVTDRSLAPVLSVGTTLSSIAWKIDGTPAITWTLPILKPGATETGLSMWLAPTGMRAMRFLASLNSMLRLA